MYALISTPQGMYDTVWMEITQAELDKFISDRGGDVLRFVMETSHGTQRFIRWAGENDNPHGSRAPWGAHDAPVA